MKTFSFNRFVLLLKKEIIENIKNAFITIFIAIFIAALLIVIEGLNSSPTIFVSSIQNSLKIYYFIGLFILGTAFAGFSFPALRKNEKSINYLSLPASAFEKFLSYFTLSTIGFFILYTILFFAFYSIVIIVVDSLTNGIIVFFPYKFSGFLTYFLIYINLNALFLLGATIFKRTPPFFTILFTGLVSLSIFIVIALLMSLIGIHYIQTTEGKILTRTFGNNEIRIDNIFFYQIIEYISLFGLAIFFWFIGFLKLKEKEV